MPDVAYGFQLHPGRDSRAFTTEVLDELATDHEEWRVGATMHVPRQRLAYWQGASSDWDSLTDFLVADPECTRMDVPYDQRGRGRDDFSYLAESDPAANPDRFVKRALDAQRQAGATVLVSPWLLHGVTQTEHELSATVRFAEIATELVGSDEHLLMGVEATQGVFATAEARNAMTNELVEGPELPVYLRMRISAPAGYKHCEHEGALEGLRDIVRALDKNERPVALPQSGLTGWLMCAFGGRSFGAGTAASMQRNTPPAGGGGGLPPLHWYFVPQLLGFVQAEEMGDIADVDGFVACDCPYCDGELPEVGASFDAELAGKHFLRWCARLASEIDVNDLSRTIATRVDEAADFAAAVEEDAVPLDPRSKPSHLPVWQTVLSG
jgi:hypothetical protein